MSKRYGRQQKRKHRQEREALEELLVLSGHLLQKEKLSNQRAKECVQDTRELLGEYFLSLPPGARKVHPELDFLELPKYQPLHDFTLGTQLEEAEVMLNVLRLPCMKVHVDKLRDQTRVYLWYGYERLGYAISEDGLRGVPKEVLIQDMLNAFADELKRKVC